MFNISCVKCLMSGETTKLAKTKADLLTTSYVSFASIQQRFIKRTSLPASPNREIATLYSCKKNTI